MYDPSLIGEIRWRGHRIALDPERLHVDLLQVCRPVRHAKDPLLERWEAVLARKLDGPAIFNTAGESVRTFRQVDDRAHDFESKIDNLAAGNVVAVQIGNHQDWPSILIACFRREVVVLPLEQSITDQQRDAALRVCRAAGVVAAG